MQAIRHYKEGRIQKLMITSGNSNVLHQKLKEADAVYEYLIAIGIPDSSIIIENKSRNTIENIQFSKSILDSLGITSKVLIYTSAWHIPRTELCTDNYLKADFFATNYMSNPVRDYSPMNLLVPSGTALMNSELMMKELVGYIFYLLKVS